MYVHVLMGDDGHVLIKALEFDVGGEMEGEKGMEGVFGDKVGRLV